MIRNGTDHEHAHRAEKNYRCSMNRSTAVKNCEAPAHCSIVCWKSGVQAPTHLPF